MNAIAPCAKFSLSAISMTESDLRPQPILGSTKYSARPSSSRRLQALSWSFLLAIDCRMPRESSATMTSRTGSGSSTCGSSSSVPCQRVLSRSQIRHFTGAAVSGMKPSIVRSVSDCHGVLSQYDLADLVAAFDDFHQLRVPVGTRHHVAILRARRGQHLDRRGGAPGRVTRADVLRQNGRHDHVRRPRVPALAGVFAYPGGDLLRGQQFGQMPGDELVLGERLAELLSLPGMPHRRAQAGTQDAHAG